MKKLWEAWRIGEGKGVYEECAAARKKQKKIQYIVFYILIALSAVSQLFGCSHSSKRFREIAFGGGIFLSGGREGGVEGGVLF